MAMIPVEVQKPCKPQTRRVVGEAPDNITAVEVARLVGVPIDEKGFDCFLGGKIMGGGKRGPRRWSLVADVEFRERTVPVCCPHCGHELP